MTQHRRANRAPRPGQDPGRDEPAELGFLAYRIRIAESVVALDVHSNHRDDFRGALDTGVSGNIHVLDVRADQHAVRRTAALAARDDERFVKFTVVDEGSGLLVQDGREAVLRAGDMVAYDTGRPYSLHFDGAMRMTVVMFPPSLLDLPVAQLAAMTAVRHDTGTGVGSLVHAFLSSLGREVTAVDGNSARRLYRTAVEMIQTLLQADLAAIPHGQDTLVARIHDYIDEHLADPDLDPTRIARDHFISIRHLHSLFSARGATVSSVIRTKRLERCYDELANPLRADRPVAVVAHHNGFVDAAHFSRCFRAHFGVSPSSLRR